MATTSLCGSVLNTGDPVRVCLTTTDETVTAAGTAYVLTATQALLDFGTTDPTVTLDATGNYVLSFWVVEQFNGATFATSRTITYKLRRTNNTPADVAGSSIAHQTGIVTTLTTPGYQYAKYSIPYSGTLGDIIQIFGAVSVLPSAGSVSVTGAEITASLLS